MSNKKNVIDIYASSYDEAEYIKQMADIKPNNVNIAENGISDFVIYYPNEINKVTVANGKVISADRYKNELKNSIKFFSATLSKMIGDNIDYYSDDNITANNKILLVLDETMTEVNGQGYYLSIKENEITIKATTYQGISNGIYSFLEEYLGCMFVSKDYDYILSLPTINLSVEKKFFSPAYMWRNVYAYEVHNQMAEDGNDTDYLGWKSKLRLNGTDFDDWGNWCHTFYTYISPKEYFKSNPEYFAEYGGIRKHKTGPVSGQLCLTNEEVYQVISSKLFKMMEESPDKHYWDVSQMDTWERRGKGCQCAKCKVLDEQEGSPMGSLLTFINRIADECVTRYPNNYISTLAYNYSVTPPKNIAPRDNVIIKLCLMPGDSASGYANPSSEQAKRSNKVVTDWSRIAKHILIWDYNINFHNYLLPYPILNSLEENNKFYLENNVYGVFHQMDRDKGGDNAELNSYIFAKLLWDKDTNVENVIAKYIKVFYGSASNEIAMYYNELNKNLMNANKSLYLYSTPISHSLDYLSSKKLERYMQIFENAEERVIDDKVLLARVKKAKIGILFTKSTNFSCDISGRKAALEQMKLICVDNDIKALLEGGKEGINELNDFYKSKMREIKATPFIVIGMILAPLGLVALGIVSAVRAVKRSIVNKAKK